MIDNLRTILMNYHYMFSQSEMFKISSLIKILEIIESNNISDVKDISGDIFIKDSTGNITHVISLENKSVVTYEEYLKDNKEEKENLTQEFESIYKYLKQKPLTEYLDDLDI